MMASLSHISVLSLLVLLIAYLLVATIKAVRATPVLAEEIPKVTRLERILYDYRVYPTPSTLFPAGTDPLPPGQKSYFANVTQRIEFEVAGEVEVVPAAEPEADLNISLFLRSPEQWEVRLDYAPEIAVDRPSEGRLAFKSSFVLPLALAVQVGEAIVEELGIRPRDAYNLVIMSSINCPLLGADDSSGTNPLVGEYVFALRGRTIEPAGRLLHEREEMSKETVIQINHLRLWGYSLDVSRARVLFPSLLFVSMLGFGICFSIWRKSRPKIVDKGAMGLERIKRRYGGRIIKVGELKDIPEGSLKIEVGNFKELVKIADERERPILQVNSQTRRHVSMAEFCVVDEGTLFFCRTETA